MPPIDFFHLGPPKTATTWVYRILRDHPQVAAPSTHDINYFDLFYHRGREWYSTFFANAEPGQQRFDSTPTYFYALLAPERIFRENPQAKLIFCLRNPVERAFSHYWHLKKQGLFNFDFSQFRHGYDFYAAWIEPGFYARHIERYLHYFPRQQMFCLLFEDLQSDPHGYLHSILQFLEIDASFSSPLVKQQVNIAGGKRLFRFNFLNQLVYKTRYFFQSRNMISKNSSRLLRTISGRDEYWRGLPVEDLIRLRDIFEPEIRRTETLLQLDLSAWRTNAYLDTIDGEEED